MMNSQDPHFFYRAFLQVAAAEESPLAQILDLRQEGELALLCDLSGIQDSFRFRCQKRSLLLAQWLIDEKGELHLEKVDKILSLLKKTGYIVYPQGFNDSLFMQRVEFILKKLRGDPAFFKMIKKFSHPLCHRGAEQLIADAIGTHKVTDAAIRQAVLAACLTLIRQNVGSCFATAPAILIHEEQIEAFLQDLYDLLTTGKLKRTFGGVLFSVPLSPSWGIGDLKKQLGLQAGLSPGLMEACIAAGLIDKRLDGEEKQSALHQLIARYPPQTTVEELIRQLVRNVDLEKEAQTAFKRMTDHALLKAWEFTLASFSEVKMEFSRWNLYSSLGFDPEEKGGIGQVIYSYLQEKLALANEQMERFQREYEIAFDQVKAVEILFRGAGTEAEARRLQAEYQSRAYHMRACLDVRDEAHREAARYSNLFAFLIKQYDLQFPEYFQEIYDADMQEIKTGPYDDSPAGFRLVYKHGRSDASLWSLIYDGKQYIDALIDFFRMSEAPVAAAGDGEGGSDEIAEITTRIIAHLRTPEFIETAFVRMAKAHRVSLIDRERLEKKPWAYTSGGTMTTLLKTYYRRESPLTEESRWVESPTDLLIFILDTLKNIHVKDPDRRMLMYSPTHAFILQPGWDFLKEGWQDGGFTYTWVRDRLILPRQRFYEELRLSYDEQQFLIKQFPFAKGEAASLQELRQSLSAAARDQFDAFLYEALPLTSGQEWKDNVRYLLADIADLNVLDSFPDRFAEWMTAKAIQDIAKGCYLLSRRSCLSGLDLHAYIARRVQPFPPLLFADTNWANHYFGFVVNPSTGQLELWRMDRTGSQGMPMSAWKEWLNGTTRAPWGIYTHPNQYR